MKEEEEEKPHSGPWHVTLRWVHDTDLFNEWMNPRDYEVDAEGRSSAASLYVILTRSYLSLSLVELLCPQLLAGSSGRLEPRP